MRKIIDLGKDGDFRPYEEIIPSDGEWTHHEGDYREYGSDEWVQHSTLSILWDTEGGFEEIEIYVPERERKVRE